MSGRAYYNDVDPYAVEWLRNLEAEKLITSGRVDGRPIEAVRAAELVGFVRARAGGRMKYGSVCSGIEAATVAWHPLGWKAQFYAEIAKFPSSVLAHHYPKTPNVGDFTELNRGAKPPPIDLLVGGTPCQSFSVAGLRGGLGDDRGNLALQFLALAGRARPRWVLWENVPGVFSVDEGRAFGSILGGLAELGYGFAWRVLDAQFFGVAQRRNRVFLVGCTGGWAPAAAVLFERSCLRGNPPPRRAKREDVAGTIGGGSGARGWCDDFDRSGAFIPDVAATLRAQAQSSHAADLETFIPEIAGTFTSEGFDASEDGTGRGPQLVVAQVAEPAPYQCHGGSVGPMGVLRTGDGVARGVPFVEAYGGGSPSSIDTAPCLTSHGGRFDFETETFVFDEAQVTNPQNRNQPGPTSSAISATSRMRVASVSGTIAARHSPHSDLNAPLAFHLTQSPISGPVSPAIGAHHNPSTGLLARGLVRRLTPREYERLFGFPDDYTKLSSKTKDGPRYRALGNSMAVPVMAWLGRRIAAVDRIVFARAA